jgi:hypothetical protein
MMKTKKQQQSAIKKTSRSFDEVVGADIYAVWVRMLQALVPHGRTPDRSEYCDFCERVARVRLRDGLEQIGVRELDRFLWLWGSGLRSMVTKSA